MKDDLFEKFQQSAREAVAMESVKEISNAGYSETVRFDNRGIIEFRELDKSKKFWVLIDLSIPTNLQRAIKLMNTYDRR